MCLEVVCLAGVRGDYLAFLFRHRTSAYFLLALFPGKRGGFYAAADVAASKAKQKTECWEKMLIAASTNGYDQYWRTRLKLYDITLF